jgi:hypothetical protein
MGVCYLLLALRKDRLTYILSGRNLRSLQQVGRLAPRTTAARNDRCGTQNTIIKKLSPTLRRRDLETRQLNRNQWTKIFHGPGYILSCVCLDKQHQSCLGRNRHCSRSLGIVWRSFLAEFFPSKSLNHVWALALIRHMISTPCRLSPRPPL